MEVLRFFGFGLLIWLAVPFIIIWIFAAGVYAAKAILQAIGIV